MSQPSGFFNDVHQWEDLSVFVEYLHSRQPPNNVAPFPAEKYLKVFYSSLNADPGPKVVLTEKVLRFLEHLGEKALEASKIKRRCGRNAEKHRTQNAKLIIELSNIEFKSQDAIAQKYSPCSLYPGASSLVRYGNFTHRFVGTFHSMVQMDDIHVAGEVTSTIVSFPETSAALTRFLEDNSLAEILDFIISTVHVKTIHYYCYFENAKDQHIPRFKKDRFKSSLVASQGLQAIRKREFGNSVT
ncbi:hypothetical protein BGZ83_007855 [Gryganskiella cystojenkinii]|nr:hypothetical protein BGZ83_007855 [Gryganskiella cystojenkinii]